MATTQSAALDRKKLMGDPILVTTIVLLITFLTLFILYPLAILLVDSFVGDGGFSFGVFRRIFAIPSFTTAITNTLKVGFLVGILSTLVGLLFAYVEVYVRMNKFTGGLFKVVSMLPVVSPPFVLSLSMIMLFGKAGIITRFLLKIYDNSVYGFWGIAVVQTLTFFPVCYMMLKGLLKNIDPSLEEAARDMGASRWKVFTSVTLPLLLPGLGNAFLVTFIESIADFANPMLIGGSYDTLATTIYLQITGAYDKAGAAAMAVVLLCITLCMFAVQKYYLERKTAATLTGKASRGRMLITDPSVKIPLTVLCSLVAIFVIMMYLCVPIGACFPTWGFKFFPLTGKWFKLVFSRYHGLQAFRDSFLLSLISAPITALLSMIISYLVVKRNFKAKGFIEAVSMLAMAVPGTVLGVGYIRGFSGGLFHTGLLQGLYGTGAILIIVFVVRSLPTGTRSGISALRQIDKSIEESAYDMGADSFRVFMTVTLPLIKDSFRLSLVSAPITALLSMIISYLVVKRKFKAKGFIEAVSMLAMAVPGTVLGVGYIRGFSNGVFNTGFLQGLYGTGLILIIVFVVRSLPTGTRSGISALRQIDKSIEESAYDMGADSFKVFMTVTLPLIKDSFLSGLVTAFVRSITAISAIILLVTPQFLLITVQINEFAEKGSYSLACAFATILIVITYGAVLLMNLFIKHFGTSRKMKEDQ